MEVEEKKVFFEELYQLDDESDGVEDISIAAVILAKSKLPAGRKHRRRGIDGLHIEHSLERTVSAPIGRASVSFPDSTDPKEMLKTPIVVDQTRVDSAKKQAVSDRAKPVTGKQAATTTGAGKKRKRGQSFNALPESQQIFKGLSFFFFPNNDVDPARAFRIRKAMEWGALWFKTWKNGITHVIIDRNLKYKDLLMFLKLQSLPPNIVVVNEDYPADCIRFRSLVNPRQLHYRVAGDEEPATVPPATTPATSETSLQLKPDKEGIARLLQTPSDTGKSLVEIRSSSNEQTGTGVDINHVPDSMSSSMEQCPRDALSEAIKEVQATNGLPIDLDEDYDMGKDVAAHNLDSGNSEDKRQARNIPEDSFAETWQQGFMCMDKHDGTGKAANPNTRTIEILQQMADYYDRIKDHWRTNAYRQAISALKKQERKITTSGEAFAIPSIGQSLAYKIEEIVCTDRLRRLENTKLDPNDDVLQLFLTIYGVGHVQATRWIEQGHRSIDDLLANVSLTKSQRIGIDHLEDFKSRIPRQEMDRHDEYVRQTVRRIDSSIQFTIGGSYRRGAQDCGDVDFIVSKPDCPIEVLRTIMLDTIIPQLFTNGYLKAGLATTRRDDGSKWHGAATLPKTLTWRRIDFLFVPCNELGAALIYFTGNDIFNRSIRLLANRKGMRLNQHGLWKNVTRGQNRACFTQGSLVEAKDEKKIFELLGVPWRPPEHRIC